MRYPQLEQYFQSFFKTHSPEVPVLLRYSSALGITSSIRFVLEDADYLSPSTFTEGFSDYPNTNSLAAQAWENTLLSPKPLIVSDKGMSESGGSFLDIVKDIVTHRHVQTKVGNTAFAPSDKLIVFLLSTDFELPKSLLEQMKELPVLKKNEKTG